MDAYYSKKTTHANMTKAFAARHAEARNITDESGGFCICPNCFHLVFDGSLTGTCLCCHIQFCPPYSIKKRA